MFNKTPDAWISGITVEDSNLVIPLNSIPELQANEVTGFNADIRKVMFALVDALFDSWNNTPPANRPKRISIGRTTSFNDTLGTTQRNYNFQFQLGSLTFEVADEPLNP
jgi:hypothetical protein